MVDTDKVFYGCPVLRAFLRGNTSLPASQEWEELLGRADNERPKHKTVRKNAVLSIAFSVEEIALHMVKNRFEVGAVVLRSISVPITNASDLDDVLQKLEEVGDVLIAETVHTKMVANASLSSTIPLRAEQLTRTRGALATVIGSTRLLRVNWDTLEDIEQCGDAFSFVCGNLGVIYSRRMQYARTMLGA